MSSSKKVKLDKQLDDGKTGEDQQTRVRAIAVQHALSIEEKKKLQGKVLDMILLAFDLPSDSTDAAHPSSTDVNTFKECLNLFRPSDLDELVEERNIDDRCGYALCKNSIRKQDPSKSKVWDPKTGKLIDRKDKREWCSNECKDMNRFVRKQLIEEPAWLRQSLGSEICLLSDQKMQPEQDMSFRADRSDPILQEYGQANLQNSSEIEIYEKQPQKMPLPPSLEDSGLVEGFPMRIVSSGTGKAG